MPSPSAPPLVVVNPAASRLADPGRRERIVAHIADAVIDRTGLAPTVVDTSLAAARTALAKARSAPLVVVVGGDGTIRETVAVLANSGVSVAIVPAGTGNVLAAALGIPGRTSAAVRVIATARPTTIDLGRASWGPARDGSLGGEAGSQVFAVACGLGFDARVVAAATGDLKRRLGFAAYVVAAAREATRLRPVALRIEADGKAYDLRGLVVLIANCGQLIPGVVGPRRGIDPTDGLLDVFVVTAAGLPGGLTGAAQMLLSAAAADDLPRSVRLQAASVRVVADPPELIQVDGDPHAAGWLAASVLPGALTILRP